MRGFAEADVAENSHAHPAALVARAELGSGRVPPDGRDALLVGAAHAARDAPLKVAVAQRDTGRRACGDELRRLVEGGGGGSGALQAGEMRAGFEAEAARARDVAQSLS